MFVNCFFFTLYIYKHAGLLIYQLNFCLMVYHVLYSEYKLVLYFANDSWNPTKYYFRLLCSIWLSSWYRGRSDLELSGHKIDFLTSVQKQIERCNCNIISFRFHIHNSVCLQARNALLSAAAGLKNVGLLLNNFCLRRPQTVELLFGKTCWKHA